MNPTLLNKALGVLLIGTALACDIILTLRGHQVPSILSSVATAGLGIVFPSVFHKCKGPAAIKAEDQTPTDPATPQAKP